LSGWPSETDSEVKRKSFAMMKSLVIKVDNPCALLWLLRLPANALAEFMNRPASCSVTRRWGNFSALSGAVFLWEARPRADGCWVQSRRVRPSTCPAQLPDAAAHSPWFASPCRWHAGTRPHRGLPEWIGGMDCRATLAVTRCLFKVRVR
jgi:hypothetical protein